MKIGFMNNPAQPLEKEIQFAKENEFDFLDLTLEPPQGMIPSDQTDQVKSWLNNSGLEIVGHTAWYLPLDSPFDCVRTAAQNEIIRQLNIFQELNARKITVHHFFSYPHRLFKYQQKIELWTESLDRLQTECSSRGIQLMLEHGPCQADTMRFYLDLMRRMNHIGFHLDVGHANLSSGQNQTIALLKKLKKRLMHVHLSDNFGGSDDLHLPLGAGKIPWISVLSDIHQCGYNDTFTLEVFASDRSYLLSSREKLRRWWTEITTGAKIDDGSETTKKTGIQI